MAQEYTFAQRLQIALIHGAVSNAIRLIGPTLKFDVSIEEGGPSEPLISPSVYCFWHQCVFTSAWWFRKRDIAVMTSRSFDGEWIARVIGDFGFRPVRGSSSQGGARALLGMRDEIRAGHTAAFTIDGPRGPRFVAKPGPVLLAKRTQMPIVCYHFAPAARWQLNSWDQTQIPRPFTDAVLRVSKMIHVPPDANDEAMEKYQGEMQQALERVRDWAEERIAELAQKSTSATEAQRH